MPAGATNAPAPPTAPSPPPIDRDLPCLRCGYNLRTRPSTGQCPECDTDVAQSLAADYLMDAEPSWLRRVRRGGIVLLAGWCGLFLIELTAGGLNHLGLDPTTFYRLIWAAWLAQQLAIPVVLLVGTLGFTASRPGPGPRDRGTVPLRLVPRLAVLTFLATAVYSVTFHVWARFGIPRPFASIWAGRSLDGATLVNLAAQGVHGVALALYGAHLAARIPNAPLAARWRSVAFVAAALTVAHLAHTSFLLARPSTAGDDPLIVPLVVVGFLLFVWVVLALTPILRALRPRAVATTEPVVP